MDKTHYQIFKGMQTICKFSIFIASVQNKDWENQDKTSDECFVGNLLVLQGTGLKKLARKDMCSPTLPPPLLCCGNKSVFSLMYPQWLE